MDKDLLQALNNLSTSLEEISESLKSKKETNSATATAIKGGDFTKYIQEINTGVKQLQKDTKKILSNQQTIMNMAKSKKEETVAENLGQDKKSQTHFKEGLGVILLMATAILALGVAFKIIGGVDFLSVVALSIALALLSISFSKIFTTLKDTGFDGKKDSANFLLAITAIALSITLSSWILSLVMPITFSKLFTTIFIGGAFALIAPSIHKFLDAFKDVKFGDVVKSVLLFPIILPAISLAIAASSWILQLIKPVGLFQLLTAVGIALVFTVISFGINKLMKAFKDIQVKDMASVLLLPIILPAISFAIAASSWVLQLVKPISFSQFFTVVFIAAAFTVISFGLTKLISAFKDISPSQAFKSAIILPVILIAISIAIAVSSAILIKTVDIKFETLLKILALGAILGGLSLIFTPVIKILGSLSLKDLVSGSLAIVMIAAAVMVSSYILSLGTYDKYPDWKWAAGVALSLIGFVPAIVVLGAIATSGIGALMIAAGAGMTLVVAATIVASSYILSKGKYEKYPPVSWSVSTAISMAAFATGMAVLGGIIVGTFGLGAIALAAGAGAVLMVAKTIVKSSYILSKGTYEKGPTEQWSKGIALALGAFAPVYGMLMKNKIMQLFGGGVGPTDFANAIRVVSGGIVDAANYFADPKVSASFKGGPSKEWSEGVGQAIGAFAPVYQVLSENSGWITSGVSVDDMKNAIITISKGIIQSAEMFNGKQALFNGGPSKEWSEGVGAALGAFAPVFESLSGKSWYQSGEDVLKNMTSGVYAISSSIASSAAVLYRYRQAFSYQIDPNFIKNLSYNVIDYMALIKKIQNYQNSSKGDVFFNNPLDGTIRSMNKLSSAYDKLAKSIKNFSSSINGLDASKVSLFKSISTTIVMPAKKEERQSLISKSMGMADSILSGVGNKLFGSESPKQTGDKKALKVKGENELQKLDRIIAILSNIDKSVGGLDDYLQYASNGNKDLNKEG